MCVKIERFEIRAISIDMNEMDMNGITRELGTFYLQMVRIKYFKPSFPINIW